jgi:hypothetical protein
MSVSEQRSRSVLALELLARDVRDQRSLVAARIGCDWRSRGLMNGERNQGQPAATHHHMALQSICVLGIGHRHGGVGHTDQWLTENSGFRELSLVVKLKQDGRWFFHAPQWHYQILIPLVYNADYWSSTWTNSWLKFMRPMNMRIISHVDVCT